MQSNGQQMIKSLSVIALTVFLSQSFGNWANAGDEPRAPVARADAETASNDDCSQQVWPHISASCLRTTGDKVEARVITISRR
jgi:hypothetical protein